MIAADSNPKLPKQCILTPHFQEMHRLLGYSERHDKDRAFLQECHNFAIKHGCTVILKGGPSFVFTPLNIPIVIAEGNTGLAKAGTGDVLTGVLAALVARGIKTDKAAILGTYLHALAGEIATYHFTHHGTMAQDVIDSLPEAYHELLGPLRTFQEDLHSCLP
jgi:NAD(P)H-hydrate epimerase